MDRKILSYGVLASFVFLAFFIFRNDVRLAGMIAGDGLAGVFWYLISDFKNWVVVGVVFLSHQGVGFLKKLFAGLAIAVAADIVSFPRLLSSNPPVAVEAIRGSLDWMVVQHFPTYSLGMLFYYIIIPVVLMVLAFQLLGYNQFLKRLGS